MADRLFIDSNIWLYAFMDDGEKKEKASAIISRKGCILSTQVVNEVCLNLISKAGYEEDDISILVGNLYSKYEVVNIDFQVILKSSAVRKNVSVSYWDSMIIAAAIESGSTTLYSEDMQHGQIIDGLTIVNPFLS